MIEKIRTELVELYQNSGSEFLDEALALIKAYMPHLCHSFCQIDAKGMCRVLATDITDDTEIMFWERALRKEPITNMKTCFCISSRRVGMRGHIVIPLLVKEEVCGAWIIESKTQDEIQVEMSHLKLASLLALFIRSEMLEKKCIQNLYLDAKTELPRKSYFLKITNRLQEQHHSVFLSVFRIVNYREGIRLYGSGYMEDVFMGLLTEIENLEVGNLYILAEDTVALLLNESEQESFAATKKAMNYRNKNISVVGAFLNLSKEENIMALLEEVFAVTPAGSIWRRELNPIASLFLSLEKMESKEEPAEEVTQELVEELLLEFMEGI